MTGKQNVDDEQLIRAWLTSSRKQQGLPHHVKDVVIIAHIEKALGSHLERIAKQDVKK